MPHGALSVEPGKDYWTASVTAKEAKILETVQFDDVLDGAGEGGGQVVHGQM